MYCFCFECRHSGARPITETPCGLSRRPGASRRVRRSVRAFEVVLHGSSAGGNARASSRWLHVWLPDHVRRMHQSVHHLVADAPWSDEALLDRALDFILSAMRSGLRFSRFGGPVRGDSRGSDSRRCGLRNGHRVPLGTKGDEPAVRGGHHE